jgi:hypothetical protein
MLKILALEQTFERILNPNFTISGIDKGNVDRIEERNGVLGL